jgi:O-antigen ligase
MLMQKANPALILLLCIMPWLIIFFYRYPMFLILLWYVLSVPTLIFPDFMAKSSGFYFLLMDPAYLFGITYIITASLYRPKDFIKCLKENKFLFIFLIVLIIYILLYTPVYGKSAIGEGRKVYFIFFFPIVVSLYVKNFQHLRQLLLATFFLAGIFIVVSLARLGMGVQLRSIANSNMALIFQLIIFSIIITHLNNSFITIRIIDISVLLLSLCILLLTQHRSVILAGLLGLVLLIWLYRNRSRILLKTAVACIAFLILVGIIMTGYPSFEKMTVNYIDGILDPQSDRTASWRMKGWHQQLSDLSTTELLFGEGLGNYYVWYVKGHAIRFEPHNGYVQIILKFGFLGLIVYVLLTVRFFRTVASVRNKLAPGIPRAFVEMGIVNFGAAHAYVMGYGFTLIMLVFYALGMNAVKQIVSNIALARQDEPATPLKLSDLSSSLQYEGPPKLK